MGLPTGGWAQEQEPPAGQVCGVVRMHRGTLEAPLCLVRTHWGTLEAPLCLMRTH